MLLNIVVPIGCIRFHFYNEDKTEYQNVKIGQYFYRRIIVFPKTWMAFTGLDNRNVLLNVASRIHDVTEQNTLPLNAMKYQNLEESTR